MQAIKAEIKEDIKMILELKEEYDNLLDIMIDSSIIKITTFCNLDNYTLENQRLKEAVKLKTIIDFNKRFKEGIQSESVSGFSTTYGIEDDYIMLINSLKKVRVF